MADRFPSIEDFTEGVSFPGISIVPDQTLTMRPENADANQNAATTNGGEDDFLTRERALLGDDADQFASTNDHGAKEADNDLLGGDSGMGGAPPSGGNSHFESSFPAIDTRNEV